jgi:hypothetical protein
MALKDLVTQLSQFDSASRKAALTVFATHKPRIFQDGRKADGSPTGIYVAGSKDKRGSNRGGQVVILSYTEQMKKDYQVTKTGIIGYGFSNTKMAERADYNEARYGKVFQLTTAEEAKYYELVRQQLFGDGK